MSSETKTCTKSGEAKEAHDFYISNKWHCKTCVKRASSARFYSDHEAMKLKNRDRNRILAKSEKYRLQSRARDKSRNLSLTDAVVKRLLTAGTSLKNHDITDALISIKRTQLTLIRATKQIKKEMKNV